MIKTQTQPSGEARVWTRVGLGILGIVFMLSSPLYDMSKSFLHFINDLGIVALITYMTYCLISLYAGKYGSHERRDDIPGSPPRRDDIPCARICRMERLPWERDREKRGVLQLKDQMLRRDGSIKVDGPELLIYFNDRRRGCYPDDAIAAILDIYCTYENPDAYTVEIMKKLEEVLVLADKRACERHGYSGDAEEKEYIPDYLKHME